MDREYDVVIVGGGPSGSTAAYYHAQYGLKTLLIDKAYFPRDKACGDGIPNKVLRLLKEMGISGDQLGDIGYRIDRMQLYSPGGQKLSYGEIDPDSEAKSFCSPRAQFDNLLFQWVKGTAAQVEEGMALEDLSRRDNRFILKIRNRRLEKTETVETPLLIGADGANSRVRKLLNIEAVDEDYKFDGYRTYAAGKSFDPVVHIFYDERTLPGYFWIFPVAENRANIGIMVERETCQQQNTNVRDLFYSLIDKNKDIAAQLDGAKISRKDARGCPLPLGHKNIVNYADGVMLIGDAASFINPITGGGIYFGMASAKAAAEVSREAHEKKDFSSAMMKQIYYFYSNQFETGFNVANSLRKFFRSKDKVERLFTWCDRSRIISNLFISLYGRPLLKRFYINPFYWAALLRN
ncbi:MAG: NAD(P)/FAD-dependent oxidoreductase [Calditrichia bacterium]